MTTKCHIASDKFAELNPRIALSRISVSLYSKFLICRYQSRSRESDENVCNVVNGVELELNILALTDAQCHGRGSALMQSTANPILSPS